MEKTKTYHAENAYLLTLVTSFARAEETIYFNNNLALPATTNKTIERPPLITLNFQFADVDAPNAKISVDLDVLHRYANQES